MQIFSHFFLIFTCCYCFCKEFIFVTKIKKKKIKRRKVTGIIAQKQAHLNTFFIQNKINEKSY